MTSASTGLSQNQQHAIVFEPRPARVPALQLVLCQALLKADRFEWVLQKGTELGVGAFVPLITRRVVAGRDGAAAKLERWRRIVTEAAEQSGRTRVPALRAPVPLGTALAMPGARVMCWEQYAGPGLRDVLVAAGDGPLCLFIGPEGGFAPEEAAEAQRVGARLVSMGPRILRSETAAIAAAALALLP